MSSQHPHPYTVLAHLRLSVLASGEALPEKCWDSDGLSPAGQTDLAMVFPRTSVLAAATHASELARAHHDKHTRAAGVFHLFRLPTDVESAIHREMLNALPGGFRPQDNLWSEMESLPEVEVSAEQGPVNLGSVDLTSATDLSRLASAYRAAFAAELSCIPFFKIA